MQVDGGSDKKKIPPDKHAIAHAMSSNALARENHRCLYTQIMDIDEDSDLCYKTPVHWLRMYGYYVYVLKVPIKDSN